MEEQSNNQNSDTPVIGKDTMPKENKAKYNSAQAHKIFMSGIKRAENLHSINIDEKGEKLSIPENKILDSYRAVIVLSISALDAYVKTF
ncbi:MAG TPA: hypothetical protein VK808_02055, partial [Bacteroidia bacterium]|nr:hypothetical protein [Bacteroidia bacterium]